MEKPISQSADAIASDIIQQMPAPTGAGVSPAPAAQAAPAAQTDSIGRVFCPDKFSVDESGRPKLDKLGRYIPKGLGRKPKAAPAAPAAQATPYLPPDAQAAPPQAAPDAQAAPAPELPSGPDKYDLAADAYSRAFIALGMGVFGEEWQPDDKAEFQGLKGSVAAYLRATQREELSPGWALAVAVGTYSAKRIPREKTQSRIAFTLDKIRAWWRGRQISRAVEGA